MTAGQVRRDARIAVGRAMRDRGDSLVLELTYEDDDGKRNRRVISPIRWLSGQTFLAMCLGREEPRAFRLGKCSDVTRKNAADHMMPVPIVEIQ